MKRVLSGLVVAVFLIVANTAQCTAQENPLEPLDTSSPRATFQSFVDQAKRVENRYVVYQQNKNATNKRALFSAVQKATELFDLNQLPAAIRREEGGASVVMLHDILLRLPEFPSNALPGVADFDADVSLNKVRLPGTAIEIVRIVDGPDQGEFLFSASTVRRLPEFHNLIIGFPLLRDSPVSNWNVALARFTGSWISTEFFDALPSPLRAIVFGTPVWKIIISTVLLAAVVLLTLFWRSFAKRQQKGTGALTRYTWALSVPLVFSSLIGLSSFFARTQLNTSGSFGEFLQVLVVFGLYLAAAWSIWLLCFVLAELVISLPKISDKGYDAHLLRLIARVVSLGSAAVIILIGADAIGVPALGILAGLGFGGVAFALAAQASVENLFGGFSFFTDRPFRVGDFVKFSDYLGTVEMIGPRSTRIRGLDSSVTVIPNAQLAKLNITNYQMRRKYLFRHK